MNLTEGRPVALKTARVSADYFHVLGAQLALGRSFSEREDRPNGPQAVVISNELWRNDLHSAPGILDREVSLDGAPYKIADPMAALRRGQESARSESVEPPTIGRATYNR